MFFPYSWILCIISNILCFLFEFLVFKNIYLVFYVYLVFSIMLRYFCGISSTLSVFLLHCMTIFCYILVTGILLFSGIA